jgi:hypothetical protein
MVDKLSTMYETETFVGEKVKVIETELTRDALGDGFTYYVKSAVLHDFFASIANKANPTIQIEEPFNTPAWRITKVPELNGVSLSQPAKASILINGLEVNGTFLRSTKLKDGFSFTVPGMFINSQLVSFDQMIVGAAEELYKEYIMPLHLTSLLTSRERAA